MVVSGSELAVWCFRRPGGVTNFGDEIGPEILRRLGYKVRHVPIGQAELIPGGSVIEHAAKAAGPTAAVWGAGLMHGRALPANQASRLRFLAVRGDLTAAALRLDGHIPRGDPGSLVPKFWTRPAVRHKIGVVRHYADPRSFPWADIQIDPSDPLDDVLAAIGSCARIASSSLHGLIVAAAYGIPAMRLHAARVAGGDFKFADHLTGTATPDELIGALP